MNRSLDSVLDSLLADINRDDSSLVGAGHVSVVNRQRGDSGSEVLSSQYLLGAEFTLCSFDSNRFYLYYIYEDFFS